MAQEYKCPYGNERCKCQKCKWRNPDANFCDEYFYSCFDCMEEGKANHDIYHCIAFKELPTEDEP